MASFKGKKYNNSEDYIVIPKGNEELVFKIRAVSDFSYFDQLVPMPKVAMISYPDGRTEPNYSDKTYQKAVEKRGMQRFYYLFIKSLEATEDLVWETIDLKNPETYQNLDTEFETLGLSKLETSAILDKITELNGLNESKIREATDRFLAGMSQKDK